MKIVLDSNIYISGILFGGNSLHLMQMAQQSEFDLYGSDFIIAEVKTILVKKFKHGQEQIASWETWSTEVIQRINPRLIPKTIKACNADNQILACADAVKAEYLITGDKKHILPLKKFHSTQIISPSEFFSKNILL